MHLSDCSCAPILQFFDAALDGATGNRQIPDRIFGQFLPSRRSKYTVSEKNPCDYVFDDNLNSKRPIVIIFGTVIT